MAFSAASGSCKKLLAISSIPALRMRRSSATALSRKIFKSGASEKQLFRKLANLTASKIFSGAETSPTSSKSGFSDSGLHTGTVKRLGRVINYIHL